MSSFCVICSSCTCGHVRYRRAGSMYGGAGGFGVCISQATSKRTTSGCVEVSDMYGTDYITDNKKVTMENLNNRLETYLETVSTRKKDNTDLEQKIKQFLEKRAMPETACADFIVKIHKLQVQISNVVLDNSAMYLTIDNGKLALDEFKVKYESELSMRQCVDADIAALMMVQEELAVGRSNVELQDLKQELKRLNSNHKEDMQRQHDKAKLGFQVKVEVDAALQDDLAMAMESMRKHYESVITQNRQDVEAWFKNKTTKLNQEVAKRTDDSMTLDSLESQIIGFRRTLCNLEIEHQAEISKKACQLKVLEETKCRFAKLLAGFQRQVYILEEQLTLLRDAMEKQTQDKTKLESEIDETRRLIKRIKRTLSPGPTEQTPDPDRTKKFKTRNVDIIMQELDSDGNVTVIDCQTRTFVVME